MADQNFTTVTSGKSELGFRSLLLLPVVEGNTLDCDDVLSFLESRVHAGEEENGELFETALS